MNDSDGNGGDARGSKKRKLRPLVGLSVADFRHPTDARATDALSRIPGLDKVLLTLYRTHPFAMQRAKALNTWSTEGYEELMARRASRL